MKIFYWSPFTSNVATIKAVINSAYGLKKIYNHKTTLVNSVGEWNNLKKEIYSKKISLTQENYKLSLQNSAHSYPPCPSKTPNSIPL